MNEDIQAIMKRLTDEHYNRNLRKSKSVPLELEFTYEAPCVYRCGQKSFIPLLPVIYSQLDYRLTQNDKRHFEHPITEKSEQHNAIASLPSYAYLYVYTEFNDSNGFRFDVYYTGKDGALRLIATYFDGDLIGGLKQFSYEEKTSTEDAQPFNCTKANHNTLDSKFITVVPNENVWLMISHAKLSKTVLRQYVDDKTLRNKRMVEFIATKLSDNKNTVNMNKSESGYLKSFHQRKVLAEGGSIDNINKINEQAARNISKKSNDPSALLYLSMNYSIISQLNVAEEKINNGRSTEYDQEVCKLLKKAKPMMVALPDPIGEVLAAGEKRNYLLKSLDNQYSDNG